MCRMIAYQSLDPLLLGGVTVDGVDITSKLGIVLIFSNGGFGDTKSTEVGLGNSWHGSC